jgi:CheY-like chemotaxis protein
LNQGALQELKFFGKNQTVLVADSTPQIARKTKQILYPFFKDVKMATTTQKVLIEYKTNKFDIVICSLSRTINFNGLDIIKQLRSISVGQVIIVNSGEFEKDTIITLFDVGINAFIPIPYTQDDFLYKVMQQSEKIYYNSFVYEAPAKQSTPTIKSTPKVEETPKAVEAPKVVATPKTEAPAPVETEKEDDSSKKKLVVKDRVNIYNESVDDKVSAENFMRYLEDRDDFSILKYTIDGFLDLDQDFEKLINNLMLHNESEELPELMEQLSEMLFTYEDSLDKFGEFTGLAEAFGGLAEFIYDKKDEQSVDNRIFELLSFLNDDLTSFIEHVFVIKDVENIHYLDDSMISSLEQVKYHFNKDEYDEEDEDDLELF